MSNRRSTVGQTCISIYTEMQRARKWQSVAKELEMKLLSERANRYAEKQQYERKIKRLEQKLQEA